MSAVVPPPRLLPSPPASFDAEPLLHLLAANKQDVLDGIIVDAFRLRHDGLSQLVSAHIHAARYSGRKARQWQAALNKSDKEVHELYVSLTCLLRVCVYHSSLTTRSAIASLFPASFHPSLVSLLSKLLLSHLPAFRSSAVSSLPSPAQLLSLSTSVHIRCSSSELAHLSAPTLLLSLRLQKAACRLGEVAEDELVTCELRQEALNTILGGLNKIQEQLSGMQ